jgi:hypothetical protein
MRAFLLALIIWLGLSTAAAQASQSDWVTAVFPERAYDFGNVARGSQLRHTFPVVNKTNSEIRIASSKPKCGCTNVRIGARVIPPGTQTTIEATIDTTKFQGPKSSGLTLILSSPTYREVDLNLNCFIRGDIMMSPGQIDFGVLRPTSKLPSASLTLTYTGGRSNWEITEMKTQSSLVKARGEEQSRAADGQIRWTVTATLQPGLTNGQFREEITLTTNDTPPQKIPIWVLANIQSAVSMTPSIINFGQIRAGETISRSNVVHIRSSAPFSLTKLTSSQSDLQPLEEKPGPLSDHALNLTLKAPATAGPFHAVVKIESDVKDEPPGQVKIFATIIPAK